jgi:hypothetical protein
LFDKDAPTEIISVPVDMGWDIEVRQKNVVIERQHVDSIHSVSDYIGDMTKKYRNKYDYPDALTEKHYKIKDRVADKKTIDVIKDCKGCGAPNQTNRCQYCGSIVI